MKLEPTKVFVPVPISERPPKAGSYMILDEVDGIFHNVGLAEWPPTLETWVMDGNYGIVCTHWLAMKEAIVLTPEQLESFMVGFADFIERKSIWGTGTGWKEHSSKELYQLYPQEQKI